MEQINLGEIKTVANTQRKFGSHGFYYATIVDFQGKKAPVLFTINEMEVAIARAKVNLEDLPSLKQSWFKRLFS